MAIIKLENLSKEYNGNLAVDDLNLSIEKNHIIGLVGPNGSGKTTTMRMICGLLKPTKGKIEINGLDLDQNLSKIQKMLGYLPQQNALFPELTVYENLYYFGIIYGVFNQKELNLRIKNLSENLGLKNEMKKRVENLSGGFQRRTAVACSLLHDPEILILDEPTEGLDPAIKVEFWNLFKKLKAKGKTILISTHYMEEVDECDEVLVLSKGKMVAFDKPDQLRKKVFGSIYDFAHPKAKISFEKVYLNLTK
jgi:ABC-2 type transport system ATP-binding protein